ncbi:MAG TPA: hypothetical protein VJH90_00840, partial [archaeon]|nr:hypothetical protein [archaeon]
WEGASFKEMSFDDIATYMGIHKQKASRVLGALKDYYGVVEKSESGFWRLTDAGKRAGKDERAAMVEILSKNQMFADLYKTFGSEQATEGAILTYIQNKYKGVDAKEVKQRFIDAKTVINEGDSDTKIAGREGSEGDIIKWLNVIQLKYTLKPPEEDISELVNRVVNEFGESDDIAIKIILEGIKENKENREVLIVLVKSLLGYAYKKYPSLILLANREKS